MVLTVAFFTDQYQKQQLLRQASAADSTLHIEPGAQGVYAAARRPAGGASLCAGPCGRPAADGHTLRTAGFAARQRTLGHNNAGGVCAVCRGRAGRTAARRHGGYGGDRRPGRCTISRPRPPPGRTARAAQPRHASTRHRCWMPPHARAWATARTPSPCVPPRRRRS